MKGDPGSAIPKGWRRILEATSRGVRAPRYARPHRRIAEAASKKRMLYYHVGKKDVLYLAILRALTNISAQPVALTWRRAPGEAIARLRSPGGTISTTEHRLLMQNLHRALPQRSSKVKQLHSPFVELIANVLRRGAASENCGAASIPSTLHFDCEPVLFLPVQQRHTRRYLRTRPARTGRPRRAPRPYDRSRLVGAAARGTGCP